MDSRVDLARLREQTISPHVDEEAVTVNRRALIDKILARYSGAWTTLRELIPNAADASAKKVTIRFESSPSTKVPFPGGNGIDNAALLKHTLQQHSIYRILVSNDGQSFSDSDWMRLKRIAEGNPDETKIGAFGVGFYSVFADCEEPLILSGRKTMAFLWKGNSLYTKASTITADCADSEITFLLHYRNATSPIPDLLSLCANISISKNINTKTKEGLMKIVAVAHQNTQINTKWLNAIDWSPAKQGQIAEELIDMACASISIYSGVTAHKATELFSSVLPNEHGRIFIGFPTPQTTGIRCHISAPGVIPAVERESIDLNARYVKTWNIEMLRAAGIACRIAYTKEIEELKSRLKISMQSESRATISATDIESVAPQVTHVFKQLTATESTPSSSVGQLIGEAFWDCSTTASVDILSTKGILPSHQVRVVSEPLRFVENVPLVPASIVADAEDFIRQLFERGMVSDMTVKDIQKELESRSLTEIQLIAFLRWCSGQLNSNQLDTSTIRSLLESAIATIGAQDSGKVVALSQIKTFSMGAKITTNMPLPDHTISMKLTKGMKRWQLEQFGWEELQIVPWSRFIIDGADRKHLSPDQSILVSPVFAQQYFIIISKAWDSLNASSKQALINLLRSHAVMPTKLGMRKPADAYFPSVKLFDDLATIDLPTGVKEKVMTALGVRKTIELNVVFDLLMSQSPKSEQKWSFADQIRYLVSVRDDIPKEDIEKLKIATICPVGEAGGELLKPGRLCKVSELFEPKDILRTLTLPVLYWPSIWRPEGPEGRFLSNWGLSTYPDVLILVGKILEAASSISWTFITQTEMDFAILAADLRPHALKFGVARDPSIQQCATRLTNAPPKSVREAIIVFGYLSGRLGEINAQLAEAIGNSKIVPIFKRLGEKQTVRYAKPKVVFLGDPQTYGDVLDFVDFGLEANSFLLKVGSKSKPGSLELAHMVIDNPSKNLGVLDKTRYLDLLRKLAGILTTLKSEKALWRDMTHSAFLLGYTEELDDSRKSTKRSRDDDDFAADDDITFIRNYSLQRPENLVVVDSSFEYAIFREHLCFAPEDMALEQFYAALGAPMLSSLVENDDRIGNIPPDQNLARKFRGLVIERTRIFLHEYSGELRLEAKWLEKSLSVVMVDRIERRISLQGYEISPHREKRTAAISDYGRKGVTLFIMQTPDFYEVST
ncbi:uncharacterized protein PV09_09298 [Verruconis gallopava]|uniref:Sacsin/Nov domain-containing protein n=1 Tax=Verruconis gallopava TaxID=253628 RepID=A0A0D2AJ77_9PEZI|nr:uncharacterized protein PV09_09298 [Verruconis gallopava]KIV98968.1 hypothetical protein PV09_09298 [Verruconis gallopava]